MSATHTWFGRSIRGPRSRCGNILCPADSWLVRGFGPNAAMPMRCISLGPLAIDGTAVKASATSVVSPRKGHA
jgi:hypothetical protein